MKLRLMPLLLCLAVLTGCAPTAVVSVAKRQKALEELESRLESEATSVLQNRLDRVLQAGKQRRLSSETNAAWQIMHGIIPYGRELMLETPDRGTVSAVDYAFGEGQIRGLELMSGTLPLPATGRVGLKARLEPGSYVGQGHVDQWIAICAMANLPRDTPIQVGDMTFTIDDWVHQAQFDVPNNVLDEFSWTLIALTHYLPDQSSWVAADQRQVSWEKMVEQELRNDIDMSPCGGTHRLAGLVRAVRAKKRLDLPDTPVWQQAEALVARLYQATKEHRGPDGDLSTYYFSRAGGSVDLSAQLASTGHLFEFVALAAEDKELRSPWIELSANRLCELLESVEQVDLDCGALYHALNGLAIYQARLASAAVEH